MEKRTDRGSDGGPDGGERLRGLGLGIRLVHEDDDVIVVDKPTGVVTAVMMTDGGLPSATPCVFGQIKRHVKMRSRRRGTRVWIIHRLDKEASGLLVFAKSEAAYESLKEQFRTKRVHRLYTAAVEGELQGHGPQASGTVSTFVAEGPDGLMHSVREPAKHAREGSRDDARGHDNTPQLAVTHYRVVEVGPKRTLIQVRLETGRKNQIRVHMSEMGHPLIGDWRYRGTGPKECDDPMGRLCLHATELGFAHPATGESMRFTSPAPEEFRRLTRRGGARAAEASEEPAPEKPMPQVSDSSWDHVAGWYDQLLKHGRSDHHRDVIMPGTLRLLELKSGQRILDLACGQGILTRKLAESGADAVGVDASEKLVEAARRWAKAAARPARFEVGDARAIDAAKFGEFDGVACVMALMNIDPILPLMRGVAGVLKLGGRFVMVILHPAFRAPGRTSWGWEYERPRRGPRAGGPMGGEAPETPPKQYRRVDGYLTQEPSQIVMNPGEVSSGREPITTWTFNRPIQAYVRAIAEAGMVVDAIEEWTSARRSAPGPRADEENRARREIPMFLAVRARKL
ncbi:MAG: methyltransferase domain-containing protein [Phycisphaerae bacterium]|nr:methyltransferase domain-containing protein [Phycisphaerae bacterium]